MHELQQKLQNLDADYKQGKISEQSYNNIRRNILDKISRIQALDANFHSGGISAEDYNKAVGDILFEDERTLDNFEKNKEKKKTKKILIVFLILLIIPICILSYYEIHRFIIISSNTKDGSAWVLLGPNQQETDEPDVTKKVEDKNAKMKMLAKYQIAGKIVNIVNYQYEYKTTEPNVFAELSPVDYTIAWGVMAEHSNLYKFHSDTRRTVTMEKDVSDSGLLAVSVLHMDDYSDQYSNSHLIPANDSIREKLLVAREGDSVELEGFLVGVYIDGYEPWVSSLSRDDYHALTGLQLGLGDTTKEGACEIMYVTDLKWLENK